MKTLNRYLILFLLSSFLAVACSTTQEAASNEEVAELIQQKEYVFLPQTMLPVRGPSRQVTADFSLIVSADSINSYLPYIGRAFTAPMDPTRGTLDFVSTNFNYQATPTDKEGWEITITPTNNREVQQMILSASASGYATLAVSFTNRQPIRFNGIIMPRNVN